MPVEPRDRKPEGEESVEDVLKWADEQLSVANMLSPGGLKQQHISSPKKAGSVFSKPFKMTRNK